MIKTTSTIAFAGAVRTGAFVVCAAASILLGAVGIAFHTLLSNWQPVAKDSALASAGAVPSGTILLCSGAALLWPKLRRWGAVVAGGWITTWVIYLHLPAAILAHLAIPQLLGVAECTAMATGLISAFLPKRPRTEAVVAGILGLCMVVFGVSHFAYLEFTAMMVPPWLPARWLIALLTGCAHVAFGAFVMAGYRRREAALAEATMMASFVLLLHIPDAVAHPADKHRLIMLGIASLLTGSMLLAGTWFTRTRDAGPIAKGNLR